MPSTDTAAGLRALPMNIAAGAAAGVVAGIPLGLITQVRDADPKMRQVAESQRRPPHGPDAETTSPATQ